MNDTTIALRFIENNIHVDVGFLPCSEIYTAYQRFVENELKTLDDSEILEDRKLYKLIRDQFNVKRTRKRVEGVLQYGFSGIRLSVESENTEGLATETASESEQDMWPPCGRYLVREWRTLETPVPIIDIAARLEMPVEVIEAYCENEGLVYGGKDSWY